MKKDKFIKIFQVMLICIFLFSSSFAAGPVDSTHTTRITKPGVLLTFDDCNMINWEKQIPLFKKYGAHVTFFIDKFDKLSPEQIKALKNLEQAGHAIGCHGLRHRRAVEYYKEFGMAKYIEDEIIPAIDIMKDNGFFPTCFAYPMSNNDDSTDTTLLKYFRHLRSGSNLKNQGLVHNNKIFIKIQDIAKAGCLYGSSCQPHTLDDEILVQSYEGMDRAFKNNEIVVLYAHDIRNPETKGPKNYIAIEPLEKLLAYAQKTGLHFYTFDDL